jgi:hypothetical protein
MAKFRCLKCLKEIPSGDFCTTCAKKSVEPRLFRIRPVAPPAAKEDNVLILIDPALVRKHGLELDAVGFPTPQSLHEWHKKNNPQLFNEVEK